ncbi:uncharacterized protein (DUF2336 family) [Nitrospirillum amazonense]|uniref:Uncharacterized protein (DUF2336 family) n=1 Tax=Nitrospirillum amazonense TaxID=28077 RepID=A0A560FIG7_9PROT|nr:DUF2336 domain-containing protein [Nitrospirillum amazonense]TWB21376.1 uncharacterized protein (DUF2336 family) [Nitrospirillum amazonense]
MSPSKPSIDYETAKTVAAGGDVAARIELANSPDTRPELLYYLADDDDERVRGAVVTNAMTPVRAFGRLARDPSDRVRALLADKLTRLLPDLSRPEVGAMRDVAFAALELLAADQVIRVRTALSSALADVECAPPKLAVTLARDVASDVAGPVLRWCMALSDEELLDILSRRPEPWVVEAVAGRRTVSRPVGDAVVAMGDHGSWATLAGNPGADLSPKARRLLAERGHVPIGGVTPEEVPDPNAPPPPPAGPAEVSQRLASAVEDALRDGLAGQGLDKAGVEAVVAAASRRLDWAAGYGKPEGAADKAARLAASGGLNEDVVCDALSWGDRDFAQAAMALLARVPVDAVRRILATQSPKAVTALAWRAGFSMRGARTLQARGAGIAPRKLLNARLGTDYPMTDVEMHWHLELFDIAPK